MKRFAPQSRWRSLESLLTEFTVMSVPVLAMSPHLLVDDTIIDFLFSCLVHAQDIVIQDVAIECRDCRTSFIIVLHLDEGDTTWSSGVPVHYNSDAPDLAKGLES